MKKRQRFDGCQMAGFHKSIRSVVSKDNVSFLTGGPSICLLRPGTSGHAVVELTSLRIDPPPRRVGVRNSLSNDDDADVMDPRTEGL